MKAFAVLFVAGLVHALVLSELRLMLELLCFRYLDQFNKFSSSKPSMKLSSVLTKLPMVWQPAFLLRISTKL